MASLFTIPVQCLRHTISPVAYFCGLFSMLAGLFNVTVTFATNDYAPILRTALVFAVVSALCLTFTACFGSRGWRWLAAVSGLPLLYVIAEVFRRGGP